VIMADSGATRQRDEVSSDPMRPMQLETATASRSEGVSSTSASVTVSKDPTKAGNGDGAKRRGPTRSQQLNKLYSLPAPVKTFPLPAFIPHNPLSLIQIVYIWLTQTLSPPSGHPEVSYQGWMSPETRSVHVTDQRSIRAFWEQGFYGKGSLSRSEPSWLVREKRRIGADASKTSEEVTRRRREERQQIKWERARKEREAIDQKLREERTQVKATLPASAATGDSPLRIPQAPTGPRELLSLPNSQADLLNTVTLPSSCPMKTNGLPLTAHNVTFDGNVPSPLNVPADEGLSDLALENSASQEAKSAPPKVHEFSDSGESTHPAGTATTNDTVHVNGGTKLDRPEGYSKQMKSPQSVHFSPTAEEIKFTQTEAPGPETTESNIKKADEELLAIEDMEHLQLSMEEAFFLSYGFGVLTILDPRTREALSTQGLFRLFRQLSYFPPSSAKSGRPDDPFMISYVVYHHFRSLGWIVRGGIKFGVDYLLYNRGPVFSHAEFAVMILPSYSDPYWSRDAETREYIRKKQSRSWSWLHCINRVNAQVKKTLILVYVDVPPPLSEAVEESLGIDKILGRYKVREIVLKRWISNRSRD